jgi:retrograde regulation protein 2
LTVKLLPKEEEGEVGALGVASSFSHVSGLVMDLGGGSTQITWMIAHEGIVETTPMGAFSFPYGAAAMTKKLAELKAGKSKDEAEKAKAKFREEMKANFRNAYDNLEIPEELIEAAKMEAGSSYIFLGEVSAAWAICSCTKIKYAAATIRSLLSTASGQARRTSKTLIN